MSRRPQIGPTLRDRLRSCFSLNASEKLYILLILAIIMIGVIARYYHLKKQPAQSVEIEKIINE